jgi:hypothetical protein
MERARIVLTHSWSSAGAVLDIESSEKRNARQALQE